MFECGVVTIMVMLCEGKVRMMHENEEKTCMSKDQSKEKAVGRTRRPENWELGYVCKISTSILAVANEKVRKY